MGTIEPHLRCGVFLLFHTHVELFAGDIRFASDAEEAGGLLVDACVGLMRTIYQRGVENLSDGFRAQEVPRKQTGDSPAGESWFAGVGTLMCRHCGKRDPVGQVSEGLDAGKDEGGIPQEKEAEPREESDPVLKKTADDEEEESDWTTI